MPAPKSANSARPSSLAKPIPGDDEAAAVESFLASQKAPPAPALAKDETGAVAQFLDSAEGNVPAEGSTAMPPDDQFAPEPGFMQANLDQFSPKNMLDRLVTGLAANDKESADTLRQKYGAENVVIKNGKINYRRSKDEKFKKLDADTVEILGDLLDVSRSAVTEAAMIPGEFAGGLAGGAMASPTGPGMLPAAGAGAYAGRVASAGGAELVADQVADAAGVPQDPSRSKLMEAGVSMAGEALLPVLGKQIIKRIPGTGAYKAAKEAGEKELVALTKQSQEVAQAASDLAEQGYAARIDGASLGLPGANVSLMGHHLSPDSPAFKQIADFSASNPKFINAQNQLAEGWGDSARNILTEIAQRGGKGPVAPEKLGETIVNAVQTVKKAEGEAIGKFKAQAMAKLKNRRDPLPPQVDEQLQGIMGELGFQRTTKKSEVFNKTSGAFNKVEQTHIIPPRDLRPLVGKFGLKSEGEVRAVVNVINDLNKANDPMSSAAKQRGIRLSDLERVRNTIGDLGSSLQGTKAGQELSNLSGNLRMHFRDVVSQGLDNATERNLFVKTMDDYSALMGNVDTLKRTLSDNTSAKAIVSSFFTGKENLDKIKALKSIAPEQFPALKEEWINQMLTEYGSRSSATGLNSTKFLDAMDKKYGKQFLKEVLDDGPGPNSDSVRQVLKVTERLEQQFRGAKADGMDAKQKKDMMDIVIGMWAGIKFKTINGVSGLMRGGLSGTDSALMDIMSRDGIEKYVASYPKHLSPDQKAGVMKNLTDMLAEHKAIKKLGEVGKATEKAVTSDPVTRTGRRMIIDEKLKPRQEYVPEDNQGPAQ